MDYLDGDDTEKVSELNVDAYQYGSMYNFFGPRTTFYGQLDDSLNIAPTPHYNK